MATPVFINEIHYDNQGIDTGERLEILFPTGTAIAGWRVALYNGNNGAVYRTLRLTDGIETHLSNGFSVVVLSLPTNGLQNGAPDGLALVGNTDTVIQFLSYEGRFTAIGGPADGLTSLDIGVSESGTNPEGTSLQLTGTGNTATDFTWAASASHTFGAANVGQALQPDNNQARISPIVANTTLAVASVASYNTLTLLPVQVAALGEIQIFAADATGQLLTLLDSFSALPSSELSEAYAPTFSLASLAPGDFLQFQWVQPGSTRTATVSSMTDEQVQLAFDDGTVFNAALGIRTATTDVLTGDAEAIDLSSQTGAISVIFSVYREAQ
ncbi:MAG: hypothetical protein AAFU71_15330, partial [Cyanobacteria bacterium J06632_22]